MNKACLVEETFRVIDNKHEFTVIFKGTPTH